MNVEDRLRQAGGALRETEAGAPAGGVSDLARRHADRRRRRTTVLGAAAALVVVAGVVAVVLGAGTSDTGHHGTQVAAGGGGISGAAVSELRAHVARVALPAGTPAEQKVAAAEQAFAVALLRRVAGTGDGQNAVVSPSSIATALAMLEPGAAGATEQQIATALQSSDLTPTEQAAGWNALTADLAAAATKAKITLRTTNDTWIQHSFPVKSAYLDTLARNFGVGVHQADFIGRPDAVRQAINADVAAATNGKITDLLQRGSIDNLTRLVLTNAVYLNAKWETPFDPTETSDGTFHAAAGNLTVPFMHDEELSTKAYSGPDVDAVELPYTNGRFAAVVIEPTATSLAQYLGALTPTSLQDVLGHLHQTGVALAMPRFEVRSSLNLNATLKALGMKLAFSPMQADLSGITDQPLYVSGVQHQAYVKVNEAGTEAAAATAVIAKTTAAIMPQLRLTIDRPFLFLVRDTQTGTILFAAAVQHP